MQSIGVKVQEMSHSNAGAGKNKWYSKKKLLVFSTFLILQHMITTFKIALAGVAEGQKTIEGH